MWERKRSAGLDLRRTQFGVGLGPRTAGRDSRQNRLNARRSVAAGQLHQHHGWPGTAGQRTVAAAGGTAIFGGIRRLAVNGDHLGGGGLRRAAGAVIRMHGGFADRYAGRANRQQGRQKQDFSEALPKPEHGFPMVVGGTEGSAQNLATWQPCGKAAGSVHNRHLRRQFPNASLNALIRHLESGFRTGGLR